MEVNHGSVKSPAKRARSSMADVALAAGVSKGAVSHVLNNRPGEISAETRARVLATMRELGYRPPPSKRAIVRGRCDILGIVMGCKAIELTRPSYYNSVFESVLEETESRGLNVTLYTGSIFEIDTLDKIRIYCDGRCDGLLLFGVRAQSPLPDVLTERAVPFVVVGDSAERAGTTSVDVDNAQGMYALVDYLRQLGHQRLGFVSGPEYVTSAQVRRAAFRAAAEAMGAVPHMSPEVTGLADEGLTPWLEHTLSLPPQERPTAFVGWNDAAAHNIGQLLTSRGLNIPADVSVVGFDDVPNVIPPSGLRLTTYRQPYQQIGSRAVSLCLERFEDTFTQTSVELIPGKLIVRQSSGPPPV